MTTQHIQKKNLFAIPVVIAMIFWGTAWSSAKVVSNMVSPDVVVFWRFSFAFITMAPLLFIMKLSLKVTKRELLFLILGAVFYTTYNQLFFKGLVHGLAGAGGVLVTTTNPIITHVLVIIFLGQKISKRSIIGLVLGLTGGFFLLQGWTLKPDEIFKPGNILFLFAATAWAVLSIVTNQIQKNKLNYLVTSFYLLGLSALLQFFFAVPYGLTSIIGQNLIFWGNLIYLGTIAMALSTTIYFLATSKFGSERASSFIFIVPTSAVLTSFIFLGEVPQWYTIVGGCIAIAAVYLINSKTKKVV
jgi:drug/metabolite transporter (DMT)-like permease